MTITIILAILLAVSAIINAFFIKNRIKVAELEVEFESKQIILDKKIKLVSDIVNKPLRKGYIKFPLQLVEGNKKTFHVDVHVIELDRYKNGKSKIKIDFIDIGQHPVQTNKESIEKFVRSQFSEMLDTKDIEWLESVNELQKERENKLKRILEDE